MNTLSNRFIRALLLCVGFSAGAFGVLKAQPTNYCDPTNWPGMGYYYCYPEMAREQWGYDSYYGSTIKRVQIFNADEVKLDAATDEDNYLDDCYQEPEPGVEAEVMLGNTYTFKTTFYTHAYGYGGFSYCDYGWTDNFTFRIFIDWNMDGDFADPGEWVNSPDGPNNDPPWTRDMFYDMEYCQEFEYAYNITIPDNQPIGKTRMRVMTAAWYPQDPWYPPSEACHNGYWDTWGVPAYYAYDWGEAEDYILSFSLSVKNTFPDSKAPNDILYAGQLYDGSTREITVAGSTFTQYFEKPFVEFGSSQTEGTTMYYRIQGPLPSTDIIYEGLDPVTGSNIIDVGGLDPKVYITNSTGIASPAGDGTFIHNSGGEYRLTVGIALPNKPAKEVVKNFTVSWPYDISVLGVTSPRSNGTPDFMMYPRGLDMAVSGTLQNTGLFPITRFDSYAYVLNSKNQVVATYFYKFDTTKGKDQPLMPKQKLEKQYGTFNTTIPDEYRVYITTQLLNADDNEPYNDRYPRQTGYFTFQVQDEIQAAADAMLKPTDGARIVAGRPFIPAGDFLNKGVGDISNAKAKFVYWKLPNGEHKEVTTIVKDLPSGRYNRKSERFPTVQIDEPGDYEGWLYIEATDDIVTEDNKKKINFTVIPGLSGTYTVGLQNAGGSRNFPTIDSALRALYYYGVQSSVTMQFTDAEYVMDTRLPDYPAWDMTSTILGLGYNKSTDSYNTLTWAPSPVRAVTRGGVTIRLISNSGRGIQFGQSSRNRNPYALIAEQLGLTYIRKFSNSAGYITIDGGVHKAIRLVSESRSNAHASAIYMGRGSRNITVANTIIENGNMNLANKTYVPRAIYSPAEGFRFTPDTLEVVGGVEGYSAGVVNRGTLSPYEIDYNSIRVDTIPNANNKILSNEITNFGYGVVSLGIGPLANPRTGDFQRYYNTGTEITGNIIRNSGRAGVLLGYEDGAKTLRNKIDVVGSTTAPDAIGVMAGAPYSATEGGVAYNSIGLEISGNDVGRVTAAGYAAGVKIEQSRASYPRAGGGVAYFPDAPDNMIASNNTISAINAAQASTNRFGVHITTERASSANPFVAKAADFTLKNPTLSNNTVWLADDGFSTTGMISGVAIQNAVGTKMMNNAIALGETTVGATSPLAAAAFYQGPMPGAGVYESDRNAFFAGSATDVYRFIETDAVGNVLEQGFLNEYKTLTQWQNWTHQDMNSIAGVDFTKDFETVQAETPVVRVRKSPSPIGSVLENRGSKLANVTVDIEGETRGAAGQRYDVGSDEFSGRQYVSDIETLTLTAPAVWRAPEGRPFADAEYVMTTAPVDVATHIRNNGALLKTAADVKVTITRQTPAGTWENVMEETVKTPSIAANEDVTLSFKLADGKGKEFVPETYTDLNKKLVDAGQTPYAVPAEMTEMAGSVTPIYRIVVSSESDEFNDNNTVTREVRFFVRRSPINMMLSAAGPLHLAQVDESEIARKLNADSVLAAIRRIGWTLDLSKQRYDLDFFNRRGWEPRTVDYRSWRTLVWSDAQDETMSRYAQNDVRAFVRAGSSLEKKNLIFASEEVVRQHTTGLGKDFVAKVLRAQDKFPSNPLGMGVDYTNNTIEGVAVGRGMKTTVKSTGFSALDGATTVYDRNSHPGLMNVLPSGDGLSQIAWIYNKLEAGKNGENGADPYPNTERTAGVASSTIRENVVFLGVDWRHVGDLERIFRASFDYIESNGGSVIPVELTAFTAKARANDVDLAWSTASETNSSHFEVERAEASVTAGAPEFTTVARIAAAGKSSTSRNYSATDENLSPGRYSYRLRMIDMDGTSKLSGERMVEVGALTTSVSIGSMSPNPAAAYSQFDVTGSGRATVEVYNERGERVLTAFDGELTGSAQTVRIDASRLASGSYTVVVKNGDKAETRNLTIVR